MTHPTPAPAMAWHYTGARAIAGIVATGTLLPSVDGLRGDETPVLWFSRLPLVDRSARACRWRAADGQVHVPMGAEDAHVLALGLYRIGVPQRDLETWEELRRTVRMPTERVRAHERLAQLAGVTTGQWLGHRGALVLADRRLRLEYFDGESWQPLPWERRIQHVRATAHRVLPSLEALLARGVVGLSA